MCAQEHKHTNDHSDDEEENMFDIGKFKFEWECDVSNENTLFVTVTEIFSRDQFQCKYSLDDLKSMKFFKENVSDIKHFIEKIIFKSTREMFYQIGFIDKDDQYEGYESLRTKKYNENDKIIIILHYQNEWITSKWELELNQVPSTMEVKLKEIVRDLQYENRKLKKEIKSIKHSIIPKGMIVMWSGSIHNIPDGYKLCDGNNGTPDLRDKFIMGCSDENKIGDVGGTTDHTHNVTVGGTKLQIKHIPQHQHKIQRDYWDIQSGGGGNKYRVLCANTDGDRDIWSNYVGGGQAHDHPTYCAKTQHLPPFMSLAFIIKV